MARNYHQGRFQPKNPHKYEGDYSNIVYRSSWEFHFMRYCDSNPNVLYWSSEETVIPYFYDVDQKMHRYFVDFKIKVRTKDGALKTMLIEIKPKAQVEKPKDTKINKRNQEKIFTWIKNQQKWKAAKSFAENRGMSFIVLTEEDLGIK